MTLREEFVISIILEQDKNLAQLTEQLLKSILENEMFNTVSELIQCHLQAPRFILEIDTQTESTINPYTLEQAELVRRSDKGSTHDERTSVGLTKEPGT